MPDSSAERPLPRSSSRLGRLADLLGSKFVTDTFYLQVGTFVTAGTYVATSMLLARSLGPVDLGRYDLAYKFYTFCFFIANLGLINVTVVRYSQATGKDDRLGRIEALAGLLKIYLIMAVLILVLGYLIGPPVGRSVYGDAAVGSYGWALCLIGLFDIMRAMVKAAMLGARQMKNVARFESAIAISRVLVLLFAILGGYGLPGIIYGSIFHALLSSVMGLRFYRLLQDQEGPDRALPLKEVFRSLIRVPMKKFFSLGFAIALNKNIMELTLIFGSFFMAKVSFYDNGLLRIATILMWGLQLLLGGVSMNLLPTLGFKLSKGGHKEISSMGRTLFKVAAASGILFIALTALFLSMLPWIVKILYGADFQGSVGIVWILASSHLVLGFSVIIEPFYIYADRLKTSVKINLLLLLLIIPAGFLLMKYFGALGVAWYLAAVRGLVVVHLIYIACYFIGARRRAKLEGRP